VEAAGDGVDGIVESPEQCLTAAATSAADPLAPGDAPGGDSELGQDVGPQVVGVEAEPAGESAGHLAFDGGPVVAPHDSGATAGLLNAGLQVGAALGLSALASIAATVTRNHQTGRTVAAALTDGYASGLVVAAVFFAAGAVVALATVRTRITGPEMTMS
jgi:hypothetical protein